MVNDLCTFNRKNKNDVDNKHGACYLILCRKSNKIEVVSMASFASRLRELRKEKGLSQKELSATLNVTKGCIANYEQGQREPAFEFLNVIAEFFDVDMNYLLGMSDKRKESGRESELKKKENEEEALFRQLMESLPAEKQQQVLDYALFLLSQQKQ